MTEHLRSDTLADLPASVDRPDFAAGDHDVGIVHLGLGAFHRAHQAFYVDRALSAAGGDWRIAGVSMRSGTIPDLVNAQDGLFTLVSRSAEGDQARVIASIAKGLSAQRDQARLMDLMTAPTVRMVTITVTEKGYGIDRSSGRIDRTDPVVAGDLAALREGSGAVFGVMGLLTRALLTRRDRGGAPFTVVSCDNLPENGRHLRDAVLDFAQDVDDKLTRWIAENVTFPSSMVDRITPASTDKTRAIALAATGLYDELAVETEPFHQWVIEDRFCNDSPDLQAAGVMLVDDVRPYEAMKLRLLNGAHSVLAYGGVLLGHPYIRDAVAEPILLALSGQVATLSCHTVDDVRNVNLHDYQCTIFERFANPAIAHETLQIATDGSQKLPQRLFQPATEVLQSGGNIAPYAFATALWMRFCTGRDDAGQTYPVNDPRADAITAAAIRPSPTDIVAAFSQIAGIIPAELTRDNRWQAAVTDALASIASHGVRRALRMHHFEGSPP